MLLHFRMATKKLKLHSSLMPGVAPQTTEWTLCVLCQQSISESLRDPLNSMIWEPLKCIWNFRGKLESIGRSWFIRFHNTKWHRTYYTMCDKKMIDRARKRKNKQQSPEINMSPLKGIGFGLRFLQHLLKLHCAQWHLTTGKIVIWRYDSNGCCLP